MALWVYECAFYALVIFIGEVYIIHETHLLGRRYRDELQPFLKQGWMGGNVDASDLQWGHLRTNLPLLSIFLLTLVAISRITKLAQKPQLTFGLHAAVGIAFAAYLHGGGIVWVLLLCAVNYLIPSVLGGNRAAPWLTWCFGVAVLFLAGKLEALRFASVLPFAGGVAKQLDQWRGPYRWTVAFNMTLLRLISYNMDRYWAANPSALPARKAHKEEDPLAYSCRQSTALDTKWYNSVGCYLGYVFYAPLYLAGPTTTFNAFASHVAVAPQRVYDTQGKARYALRVVSLVLLMEAAAHYIPLSAIQRSGVWREQGAKFVCILGYLNLNYLWLKFAIIWRFFRLFALLDDVEVPENMRRCMNDNFAFQEFWRDWHASFNRWIVRYMYIPLGGARYKALAIFPIFTFVAFWHDLDPRLFAWAWLICLLILPEMLAFRAWRSALFAPVRQAWWGRYLQGTAAMVNIFLMMVCNLIGFGVGVQGVLHFLSVLFSREGWGLLAWTVMFLSMGAQIQIRFRDWERRRQRDDDRRRLV